MYNCEFSGTIPTWLRDLSKLQYLYLNKDLFTGTIPSTLGELTEIVDVG